LCFSHDGLTRVGISGGIAEGECSRYWLTAFRNDPRFASNACSEISGSRPSFGFLTPRDFHLFLRCQRRRMHTSLLSARNTGMRNARFYSTGRPAQTSIESSMQTSLCERRMRCHRLPRQLGLQSNLDKIEIQKERKDIVTETITFKKFITHPNFSLAFFPAECHNLWDF
jgi:hypothetical protein